MTLPNRRWYRAISELTEQWTDFYYGSETFEFMFHALHDIECNYLDPIVYQTKKKIKENIQVTWNLCSVKPLKPVLCMQYYLPLLLLARARGPRLFICSYLQKNPLIHPQFAAKL